MEDLLQMSAKAVMFRGKLSGKEKQGKQGRKTLKERDGKEV